MKHLTRTLLVSIVALVLLSGCVVYEPRPRVYAYPAYAVYDGPDVVVVHSYYGGGYYGGGYYRGYHRW